jgi:histidine triad (HIT) family protein
MSADCVFCKIVNKDLPAEIIYEDEDVMAFLDISPVNKGHSLVIPKEHFENSLETPDDTLVKMIKVVKKVVIAVKDATNAEGINIGVNNGKAAGQMIFHTHWHVIPRYTGDGKKIWDSGQYESDEEAGKYARDIRAKL